MLLFNHNTEQKVDFLIYITNWSVQERKKLYSLDAEHSISWSVHEGKNIFT